MDSGSNQTGSNDEQAAYESLINGRYADAAAMYSEILMQHPNYVNALCNLGIALSHIGLHHESFAAFDKALALVPRDEEILHNYALALGRTGGHSRALDHLRQALLVSPDSATLHYDAGVALDALGNEDAAILEYETAVAIEPEYKKALWNLGLSYFYKHRLNEATAVWIRLAELDPQDNVVHLRLAEAYADLAKPRLAARQARTALGLASDSGSFNDAGMIFAKLGDHRAAIRCYKSSVNSDPAYVEAWVNLGISLDLVGRFRDAQAAYRKALDLRPDDVDALINYGVSLKTEGRRAEAATYYLRALELDPENQLAADNLASQW